MVLLRASVAELGSYAEGPSYVMAGGGWSNLNDTTWVRLAIAVPHHLHVIRGLSALCHMHGKTFLLCLNPIHAFALLCSTWCNITLEGLVCLISGDHPLPHMQFCRC